jgi:hypothetical protein
VGTRRTSGPFLHEPVRGTGSDTFYLDPGRDTVDVQTYVRVGWSYARGGRAYIHVSLDGRTCELSAMC